MDREKQSAHKTCLSFFTSAFEDRLPTSALPRRCGKSVPVQSIAPEGRRDHRRPFGPEEMSPPVQKENGNGFCGHDE